MKKKLTALICLMLCGMIFLSCASAASLSGYDTKQKTYTYVCFGSYPTGADGQKSPVLWRVLSADDKKAYLLSDLILDSGRIDPVRNTKWNDSELYQYLNTTIIADMFTGDEVAVLMDTENVGLLTLPSIQDLQSKEFGFGNAKEKQCQSTEYAKRDKGKKKTLFVYQGKQQYSPYWTRTQSDNHKYAFRRVMDDGKTGYMAVENAELGVRPAVYVNLSLIKITSGSGSKDDPYMLASTLTGYVEPNDEENEEDSADETDEEESEEELPDEPDDEEQEPEKTEAEEKNDVLAETGAYNEHFPALTENGFLPDGEKEFIYKDDAAGEWLYASDSLRIEIVRKTDLSKKNRPLRWLEADIYVKPGTDFMKVFYADHDKTFKKSSSIKATEINKIAKNNHLVFAINADYYYYRVKRKTNIGVILRENEILYDKPASKAVTSVPNRDILALYEDGSLEVYDYNEIKADELKEKGAYDVLSFGPVLVKDGEVTAQTKTISAHQSNNPRMALGQVEPGHYVAMLVEGRISESKGCTLVELAEKFIEKGCVSAYNLDGGGTASMMFMGEYLNKLGSYTADKRTQIEVLGIGISDQVN